MASPMRVLGFMPQRNPHSLTFDCAFLLKNEIICSDRYGLRAQALRPYWRN